MTSLVSRAPHENEDRGADLACCFLAILSKSLRPLPEKYHGLQDVERRYRERYTDLIVNEQARDIFKKRAQVLLVFKSLLG